MTYNVLMGTLNPTHSLTHSLTILMLFAESMAWKRPVEGIREMCDSCNTTMFNVHWTCSRCGHAVCIDCYTALRQCTHKDDSAAQCKPCEQVMQRCSVRRQLHSIDDLIPTQIIPSDGVPHFLFIVTPSGLPHFVL